MGYRGEETMTTLSCFHRIPQRDGRIDRQADGGTDIRTDRQKDLLYQYRHRASVS